MSQLRIYNTFTRTKEAFVPLTPGAVRIYSCGVTVYDHCHVGHARSVMVFDVICRYLAFRGFGVTFVRNYTDVDDKIIRRAQQEGVAASQISERFIREFRADMEALGVLPPPPGIAYHDPRATDFIPAMVELVQRLIEKGFAYVVDGDVYFEIAHFPPYGRLSGKNLDDLMAGARVEVDERKRDPRDFVLWKAAKPGEPAWPSPWGPGRPGWHIECSVMAMHYLGESFDIHGGGVDLIFPHHECEIAQSEAATDQVLARYWAHNGLVNLGAEKMSKSLGNTLLIRDLTEHFHQDAIRYYLLQAHYRSSLDFARSRLDDAGRGIGRLRNLITYTLGAAHQRDVQRLGSVDRSPRADDVRAGLAAIVNPSLRSAAASAHDRFIAAMDDDFNTPEALAALFEFSRVLFRYRDDVDRKAQPIEPLVGAVDVLWMLGQVLGLFFKQIDPHVPTAEETDASNARDNEVARLMTEREEARKARDWSRADDLRRRIEALGATLADTPAGTRLVWKDR